MLKSLSRLTTTVVFTTILSASASNAAGIRSDEEVFSRLLTAAIGNEIKDNCPEIEVRTMAATFYVLGILNYAMNQGYSRAEIDEFRADPVQQEKLRQATYAYLDAHSVNRQDPASYCPLGQDEIAKGSEIGKLIKSK